VLASHLEKFDLF